MGSRRTQRRDSLFLRALSVLRGSIFNFSKRGVGTCMSTVGQHRNGAVMQGQFPGHFYFDDSGALVTGPRIAFIFSTLNTFGTDFAKSSGKSNSLSSQLKSGRPIR